MYRKILGHFKKYSEHIFQSFEGLLIKLCENDDIYNRNYFPQYFEQPLKITNFIKISIIFCIREILGHFEKIFITYFL